VCRDFDFVVDDEGMGGWGGGGIGRGNREGEGMMVRVCKFRYKIFSRR